MRFQCPECKKEGKTEKELCSRGCSCGTLPQKVLDPSDRMEFGKIGSFQKIQGKKIVSVDVVGNNIKRLRPLCVHDGKAYALTYVPVRKTISHDTEKGEIIIEQINHTTIPYFITSSREIIPAESTSLSENFQLPITINGIVPRWEIADLFEFISYETDIDIVSVYKKTESVIRRYIDLESDSYYAVVTLWVIGTYCSRLFSYYPYLDFYGTKGSAKSKILRLLEQLVFNGMWFNNISGSSTYRSIESLGCTLLLDETENLKNPQSEEGKFLLKLLKGAFAMDAKIMVNVQNKEGGQNWVPYPFDAGTCIAMGHINGIDDVLDDRTIPIPMQVTLNKDIAKTDISKEDNTWQDLRNQYYRLYLLYFEEMMEISRIAYDSSVISNRELNQIWMPIITLARFFERHGMSGIVNLVESAIMQSHSRKTMINRTSNLDVQILECIVSYLTEQPNLESIQNSPFWYKQDEIFRRIQTEEGLGWIQSSRIVGESLDRLGFNRKKNKLGKIVHIDTESLRTACKRHFVDFPSSTSLSSLYEENLDAYGDANDVSDDKTIESSTNSTNSDASSLGDASDAGDSIKKPDLSSTSFSSSINEKPEYFICYSCNKDGTEPTLINGTSRNGITYNMHVKKGHKVKELTISEYQEYLQNQDPKNNLFGDFPSRLSKDERR